MAKVRHEKPLDRRQVVKARRFIHYRNNGPGHPVAQTWPKPRGPVKKPRPKAWVEHFVKWAHWSKQPDPCAVSTAATLVPTTGYWPRDVIHRAGNGKMVHHRPNTGLDSPLPYLFMNPPNKRYEGPPRVITPTTAVITLGNFNYPAAGFQSIIPDKKVWDNNAFWDPASHPERLTFRVDGLFLITACLQGYTGGSGTMFLELRDQTGTRIAAAASDYSANYPGVCNINLPWYFYAGNWCDLRMTADNTGAHYKLLNFGVVAITPEAII